MSKRTGPGGGGGGMKSTIDWKQNGKELKELSEVLGGGNGGAGGIFPELLVGAPGGAEEIDEVELFGEPEKREI